MAGVNVVDGVAHDGGGVIDGILNARDHEELLGSLNVPFFHDHHLIALPHAVAWSDRLPGSLHNCKLENIPADSLDLDLDRFVSSV